MTKEEVKLGLVCYHYRWCSLGVTKRPFQSEVRKYGM